MCGISGVVAASGHNNGGATTETLVAAMNADLARRGPDAEGLYSWNGSVASVSFGHRRLSIFDLSELGRQPMIAESGDYGLVFNGAVFNFHALRDELIQSGYRFKSSSDTEVILHGYHAWGIDRLVAKMRGMFAIAIWDQRQGVLYLLRDRLGVKPLLYAQRGSTVAFASTARALVAAGFGSPSKLDPDAVAEFFEFGYVTDDRVIFEGLHKVPAATLIEFRNGVLVRQTEYWQESTATTTASNRSSITFEQAVEEAERLFLEAVKLRLEADVKVGALLSGGVDSSLVCWAIAKLGGDIQAFTVGTPGDPLDETDDAIDTARRLGIAHQVVEMSEHDEPDIADLLEAYGEPFGCSSALGMLRVSKAIKPSATVLLTGDGGDDCFLGYPEFRNYWRSQQLASAPLAGSLLRLLWKPYPGGRRNHWTSEPARRLGHFLDFATGGLGAAIRIHDGLPHYERHGLLGARLRGHTEIAFRRQIRPDAASARHLLPDFIAYSRRQRFVGEYLTKVDGGAMHYALEARSPFLDQELWNFAQALPFEVRLRGGELKAVLREMARRHVGERIASGRKRGFSIPVSRWLTGKWKPRFLELLGPDSRLARQGWIDAAAARRYLESQGANPAPVQLWYVFVFEQWLRWCESRHAASSTA